MSLKTTCRTLFSGSTALKYSKLSDKLIYQIFPRHPQDERTEAIRRRQTCN